MEQLGARPIPSKERGYATQVPDHIGGRLVFHFRFFILHFLPDYLLNRIRQNTLVMLYQLVPHTRVGLLDLDQLG